MRRGLWWIWGPLGPPPLRRPRPHRPTRPSILGRLVALLANDVVESAPTHVCRRWPVIQSREFPPPTYTVHTVAKDDISSLALSGHNQLKGGARFSGPATQPHSPAAGGGARWVPSTMQAS